jgi:Protease inhibitor Inh
MQRGSLKLAAVIIAVVATGFGDAVPAQNAQPPSATPQDVPPEFSQPQNPPPTDVPPQFQPPQATPGQHAPVQNAPGAPQNSTSDAVNGMIGAWEFSNSDHNRICHFNFRPDPLGTGYRLDIDKNCPNLFPSTKDIIGWAVDNYGNLRLFNAGGQSVIELTEVEGGMYDGFTPEEGRYILQTAAAAPMLSADTVAGSWAVSHAGNKSVCVLTLANAPAGASSPAGDALAVTVKPGCDPFVMRFGPTGWRMDEGELVLISPRGLTWQFEQNDANTWQRVPETTDPILLVRQ